MSKSHFSHLLVPHDGTEISDIALDEAIRFAKMFDSKLTLLFVVEEQIVPPSLLLSFIKSGSDVEQSKKNIISLLKTGAEALLKDRSEKLVSENISFDVQIGIGSPSKEILEFAKKTNIDAIIMGRKQISGFGSLKAIGSVARKVSELSQVPVMLVHQDTIKENNPPYSNILVPYDGSEYSDRALEYAVRIAETSGSTIWLFNIIEEILLPPTMQTLKFRSEITGEEVSRDVYLKELHQMLKNEMRLTLETIKAKYKDKPNIAINVEVVIGYPPGSIIRKIEDDKFALVVMGTVGLRGLSKLHVIGSVARKVSENCACNILLVH
ncbi:universal stress protein [Candidatus Nitrosocosmicus agrestis]|uniref:universal stress protein n=1 Tax=Candidatus Nitrosocosmicus agrestis TaxID=2563600 RepID=UPI00122E3EA8|nr:universal stress protein [Candidatus Nitrosocosmicus sp. SS]KAA2283506.1 universal stress protein [Candidatus Nitrosocosmicus sp. SS]KAF0869587.1 universal stress protein [Candidatus Nitrosocosmicus sp. SS]MDR4490297.1 universal stress protein [Candidatus Nitrosocosmicus sp.]